MVNVFELKALYYFIAFAGIVYILMLAFRWIFNHLFLVAIVIFIIVVFLITIASKYHEEEIAKINHNAVGDVSDHDQGQQNHSSNNKNRMSRWERISYYNLDDDIIQKEIDNKGWAEIAAWNNEEFDTTVSFRYEPSADKAYIVTVPNREYTFEQEGRYRTREAGKKANKELMRNYPIKLR